MVKAIPDGMAAVTPYFTVEGADKLIEFLQKAFDATLEGRHDTPEGKVMHAQVRIHGAAVMMGEAGGPWRPRPGQVHLYVPDVDEAYRRAMAAGAKSLREPADQFYGDRSAGVEDPCGNYWWIATHVEDVSSEEMAKRMKEHRPQ